MDDPALRAFLGRPLAAVVCTLRADGSPHAVPVWYRWDGERLTIWSDQSRAWVRHLQRDPRVAVAVQEHEPPFAAVVLRGRAAVATDADATLDEARRICARYLPRPELNAYVERGSSLGSIVTIRPDTVRAWERGY